MNGLAAHHASQDTLRSMHINAEPWQDSRINASNGNDMKKTLGIDAFYHKANFVHMGSNHHRRSRAVAQQPSMNRPHNIGLNHIGVFSQSLTNQVSDQRFSACDRRCFQQALQIRFICEFSHKRPTIHKGGASPAKQYRVLKNYTLHQEINHDAVTAATITHKKRQA